MLNDAILIGLILFIIGVMGFCIRRNIFILLMSLELMLNSINLILIAGSNYFHNIDAKVLVLFIYGIAAAEVALGLAILINIFRLKKSVDIEDLKNLRF